MGATPPGSYNGLSGASPTNHLNMPVYLLIRVSDELTLAVGHECLIFDFVFFASRLDLLGTSISV